jgi:hypothetical protein
MSLCTDARSEHTLLRMAAPNRHNNSADQSFQFSGNIYRPCIAPMALIPQSLNAPIVAIIIMGLRLPAVRASGCAGR